MSAVTGFCCFLSSRYSIHMSILDPGQTWTNGAFGSATHCVIPFLDREIRAGGDRDCGIQAIRHLPR